MRKMNEEFFYDPEREEQKRIHEIKMRIWKSIKIKYFEYSAEQRSAIYIRELEKRGIISISARDKLAKLRGEMWKKP